MNVNMDIVYFVAAVIATFCILKFVFKVTKTLMLIGLSVVIVLYFMKKFSGM